MLSPLKFDYTQYAPQKITCGRDEVARQHNHRSPRSRLRPLSSALPAGRRHGASAGLAKCWFRFRACVVSSCGGGKNTILVERHHAEEVRNRIGLFLQEFG